MFDPKCHDSNGLERLELSDLLSFNSYVSGLSAAGVPIRFPGAPRQLCDWLQGISNRMAVNVGMGQKLSIALSNDPHITPAYLSALAAWQSSKDQTASNSSDDSASLGDFQVLEPWVRSGIAGNRQVDRSALYAFWLWVVALMGSIVMIHSVWTVFPKIRQLYNHSGYALGGGYRWLEWLFNRLTPLSLFAFGLLILAPLLWRFWFEKMTKHHVVPKYYSRLFFLAYLLLGGLVTLVVGLTVFWPVIEMLIQIGEPRS